MIQRKMELISKNRIPHQPSRREMTKKIADIINDDNPTEAILRMGIFWLMGGVSLTFFIAGQTDYITS